MLRDAGCYVIDVLVCINLFYMYFALLFFFHVLLTQLILFCILLFLFSSFVIVHFMLCWGSNLSISSSERFWCVISVLTHRMPTWCRIFSILTGGGVNLTPPCTNPRLPRDCRRYVPFQLFSFKSCASFYQVCENRTVRQVDVFSHVLPKIFCIGLCTKHTEITDFLKMH